MSLSPPPAREKIPVDARSSSADMPRVWLKWFDELRTLVLNTAAGIANWADLNFSNSDITDIQTRNHDDLQNLNTADNAHLYLTDRDALVSGSATSLHKHDFNNVEAPTSSVISGAAHIQNLQQFINHIWSAGQVDGGDITDNLDGTVTIAQGTAMLHASSDPHTTLYEALIPQKTITLTDNSTNYIAVDYNSGTPQYSSGTSITSFNCIDKCIIYVAYRDGTVVHYIDVREQNVDGNRKTRRLILNFARFIHAEGGTALGASGLAITVTAGTFYFMLEELTHSAFDTSVAGTANANVFTLWNHVAGVYTSTADQKTITTTTYDNGTGVTTLGNNKFGVTWFYIVNDAPSELHAVMGQAEYASAAAAAVASAPATLPGIISGLGSLIGYVIYEKSAVSFNDVKSAFTQRFTSSTATSHEGLADLQGGAIGDHTHFLASERTDLTDGGDSTLHYHASDRALANATGTLANANGGTGQNSSAWSGIPKVTTGTWSVATSGTDYSAGTSALATGILKSTTTTGDLSIAVAATDYVAPSSYASSNGLTMATARLLGRSTAGTGAAEEISIGTGLSLSAGTLTATSSGSSWTYGTPINTTSGTTASFTGLPSGINFIKFMFNQVSSNGSSNYLIQISTGTTFATSGYASTSDNGSGAVNSSQGFIVIEGAASCISSGIIELVRMTGNTWVCSHVVGRNDTATVERGSGVVSLGGTLDGVRLTTVNGTDAFDAGSVNIVYQ